MLFLKGFKVCLCHQHGWSRSVARIVVVDVNRIYVALFHEGAGNSRGGAGLRLFTNGVLPTFLRLWSTILQRISSM